MSKVESTLTGDRTRSRRGLADNKPRESVSSRTQKTGSTNLRLSGTLRQSEPRCTQQLIHAGRGESVRPEFVLARFTLPRLPPSTNRLFFNEPGKGRTKTSKYRAWRISAGWELKLQRVQPIRGPVLIEFELPDLSGRLPDLDNTAKGLIDLLVVQRIIEEDDRRIVRGLSLNWNRNLKQVIIVIKRVEA